MSRKSGENYHGLIFFAQHFLYLKYLGITFGENEKAFKFLVKHH